MTMPAFRSLLPVLVLLAALALVPALHPSNRILSLAGTAAINVVALYGLALLFGQTGILSMGHAALVGVGAYTAAILARDTGLGFWPALPCAALASAALATLIGIPSLRVGGHHFVILTFASGQLLTIIATNGGDFTGRATGLDVGPIGGGLDSLPHFYLLSLGFVAACVVTSWAIINSRFGRRLRAVRENEKLAASLGIECGRMKIAAFALSGAYAGISGVLLAYFLRHISPSQFASFPSIYLALMVMIGGPRLLLGPLAGGVLVSFLPELFNLDPVTARILYGVCLIAVILLLPNGLIAGLADALRGLLSRRPRHQPAPPRETGEVQRG